MPQFRKKPVVIEAVQYTGINERIANELEAFMGKPPAIVDADGKLCLSITTLEGEMLASPGDWIIKGVKGEFYPCKPDIFAATYDPT
jgi:hypothetical protein